jgi:hypothetical protein
MISVDPKIHKIALVTHQFILASVILSLVAGLIAGSSFSKFLSIISNAFYFAGLICSLILLWKLYIHKVRYTSLYIAPFIMVVASVFGFIFGFYYGLGDITLGQALAIAPIVKYVSYGLAAVLFGFSLYVIRKIA